MASKEIKTMTDGTTRTKLNGTKDLESEDHEFKLLRDPPQSPQMKEMKTQITQQCQKQ